MANIQTLKHGLKIKKGLTLTLCISIIFVSTNLKAEDVSTIERSGDMIQYAIPTLAFTTTVLLKDWQGSRQFMTSFVANSIVTFGLKAVVEKQRPDGSNYNSFPSGHTSSAFQGASFIQARYGWKYGAVAYFLSASYVGFSRIHSKKHDFIDVCSGALIGITSNYYLVSNRDNVSASPIFEPGILGLNLSYKW
jgi:membrane-associated phospholipid phosphatase